MNSGSRFQGLNSALPKNPRKANNPFGTTPYGLVYIRTKTYDMCTIEHQRLHHWSNRPKDILQTACYISVFPASVTFRVMIHKAEAEKRQEPGNGRGCQGPVQPLANRSISISPNLQIRGEGGERSVTLASTLSPYQQRKLDKDHEQIALG